MPSQFHRLPQALQAELVRLVPGATVHVPCAVRVPHDRIVVLVRQVMDSGCSQWAACVQVASIVGIHRDTVWRIVTRARGQRAYYAPEPDPEYGHGIRSDRAS